MEEELNVFVHGPKVLDTDLGWDTDDFTLDFDMIDWSAWEQNGYVQVLSWGIGTLPTEPRILADVKPYLDTGSISATYTTLYEELILVDVWQ